MDFGDTLQKIRKNRQMTQKELAYDIAQQGTYSRIEQSKLALSAQLLVQLTTKLNMTVNEFLYVHTNYTINAREKLIRDFAQMDLTTSAEIKKNLIPVQQYLRQHHDEAIQHIDLAYQALLILVEQDDLLQARLLAEQIWTKMQKLDHWYLNDLVLLNAILFLFPLDSAIEIVSIATKRLDLYKDYEKDMTYLSIYFHLDLCILYVENKKYATCLTLLARVFTQFKQKLSYQMLSYIYTYKAICLFHLGQPNEEVIQQLTTLLTLYEDEDNLTALLHEISVQCS